MVSWGVPSKGGDGFDRMPVPGRFLNPATSGWNAVVPEQATELGLFTLTN
jgi:hypothetical protein